MRYACNRMEDPFATPSDETDAAYLMGKLDSVYEIAID